MHTETFLLYILPLFFLGILLVHGMMVACLFALVKIRYTIMTPDALSQLRKRKVFGFILDRADALGQVFQFGSMLCVFILGFSCYPFLSRSMHSFLENWTGIYRFLPILGVGLCVFLFNYVLSYYVPQTIGRYFFQNILKSNSWLIIFIHIFLSPFIFLGTTLGDKILSLLRLKNQKDFNILDIQVQLRALGEDKLSLPKFTQEIVENALKMKDLQASDILLPREQVQYLDLRDLVKNNIKKAKQEGYTRYPLCETDLDSTIGIVHMQDLFCSSKPLDEVDFRAIKRPIIRVPIHTPIQKVLRRLLHKRMHMALVVDEFQRTVGIITLEHILEELVGDIQDEFDKEEDFIQRLSHHTFKVAGLTPIHELEEALEMQLTHHNVSTFGGLITSKFGRIPEKNERLCIQGLNISIDEVSKKRIISTTVTRAI